MIWRKQKSSLKSKIDDYLENFLISDFRERGQMNEGPRIALERKTIHAMIVIWCSSKHGDRRRLCDECNELLNYAYKRLDRCPFGEEKSTCAKCPIHCYTPEFREKIKQVMRFSGPKMFYKHPILAIAHLFDG